MKEEVIKSTQGPLVSVIIPVYNGELTIARAISSVRKQTYENIEIILVDNQSTDQTSNIVHEILREDERVKYLQSAKGRSRARNKGLENASGKYVNFLDADDCFDPNHIIRCVNKLENNIHLFAYSEGCQLVVENEYLLMDNSKVPKNLESANYFEILGVMFKNDKIKLFIDYLEHNEDWLFWIQNFKQKKIEYNFNIVGGQKFVTENNTMSDFGSMIGSQIIVFGYGEVTIPFLKQIKLIIAFFNSRYKLNSKATTLVKENFFVAYIIVLSLMSFPGIRFLLIRSLNKKIIKLRNNTPY